MQKDRSVCPQCGSTAWVARGLCLRCILSLGIGARGQSSETLEALLTEMPIDEMDFLECHSATGLTADRNHLSDKSEMIKLS